MDSPSPNYTSQSEGGEKMRQAGLPKELMTLAAKVLAIVLVTVLLFTFVYGAVRYQEPYMYPAVKDGDLVIYYRFAKRAYMPRDLVVVKSGGTKEVRRIIACGGDIVDITDSGLVINGALQQEPDIRSPTYRYNEGIEFPITVPYGEYFVLADERQGADDSRIYGTVRQDDLAGKVMTLIRRRSF